MTLREFELHRPKLAASLKEFLGLDRYYDYGVEITAEYSSGILFRAEIRPNDMWQIPSYVVCVGPDHPQAFIEEEAPGVPTWWWQSDLQAL